MKTFHKILCLLVICTVLASIVVIPASASATGDSGNVYVSPLAVPISISYVTSVDNQYALFDTNFTTLDSFAGDSNNFSKIETYGSNEYDYYTAFSSGNVTSAWYSGYGYSYHQGTFSFSIDSFLTEDPYNLVFLFDDIYVPGGLAGGSSGSWNWLGRWSVTDLTYGEPLNPSRCVVRYNVNYVDYVDGIYSLKQKNFAYEIGRDVAIDSTLLFENMRSTIRNEIGASALGRGIVVRTFQVMYYGVTTDDTFELFGNCKYVSTTASTGALRALEAWSTYFSSAPPDLPDAPQTTILGSIADGLYDVFNLKLFGEFTIGALFSVLVAIPLTIWILKLFAGG